MEDYLTSLNRPLLISNETDTKTTFYNSRYQLVRCKIIIITVEDDNTQTLYDFLYFHVFKQTNYFIIFNLTIDLINSGQLAKFNSLVHVLLHSKGSYQSYDYIQDCNCLKLARFPFCNILIPPSIQPTWNFNHQIVLIGNKHSPSDHLGPICSQWNSPCNFHFKIIEIQRKYFNFTPHYKGHLKLNKYFWEDSLYEKDVQTYISDNMHDGWNRNYSNDSLQYFFTSTESHTLAYCEDELKFHSFSFQYWVSPFQLRVWIFIIVGIFVTSVIASIGSNLNSLYFAFFIHVSFLFRQGLPVRISLLQLGVIFACFLISTLYECYITSDMMIPDSPKFALDAKELLVNWGYHINQRMYSDEKENDAPYQLRGFQKYNITSLYEEKVKISLESNEASLVKTGSKSSAVILTSEEYMVFHFFKFLNPERFCHTTVEPFLTLRCLT